MIASSLLWPTSSPRLLNHEIPGCGGGEVNWPVGPCALAVTWLPGPARTIRTNTHAGGIAVRQPVVATTVRASSRPFGRPTPTTNAQSSALRRGRHRRQAHSHRRAPGLAPLAHGRLMQLTRLLEQIKNKNRRRYSVPAPTRRTSSPLISPIWRTPASAISRSISSRMRPIARRTPSSPATTAA